MGTICASPYTNIFIAEFESRYICLFVNNLQYDSFMIWKVTHDQLKTFLEQLNEHYPTIKFDYKISKEVFPFVHTKVSIKQSIKTERLKKNIYRKEADCQFFLHSKSEYYLFLKQSTPDSQVLRLRWICSTIAELQQQ